MKTIKELKERLNNYEGFRIFEIGVVDKRTGEDDFIMFDISIDGNKLIAQHVALTEEEETSDKIAFKSIDIDTDFSLDENLHKLYDECVMAITNSEFYEFH